MLGDLKTVLGAVARKDFVPALTHFRIRGGRVEGFNGQVAVSTPTDLDVTAFPKAVPFVKALERLPDGHSVVLNLTQAGKLSVRAGPFSVYVECLPDDGSYPELVPEGVSVEIRGDLIGVLRRLWPFIGVDASRPWAMGVLLSGNSAYATNNVVLVEHWMPDGIPAPMCLPSAAIKEMLRMGHQPISLQLAERSATFHYADGSWLRTSLGSQEWPPVASILDRESSPIPIHPELFSALHRLDAFADATGRVYLRPEIVATSQQQGEGASVDLQGFDARGCFHLQQLASLESIATSIDLSVFPAPCPFFGDMLRGVIVGYRE